MIQMMRTGRWYASIAVCFLLSAAARAGLAAQPLTLNDCVQRALKLAPEAQFAAAGADLSQAQVRETRSSLLPALRTDVEYNQAPGYDERVSNRGLSSAQLLAEYLAFDGGRRLSQLRAARYRAQAATLGADAARRQVTFDTELAYFDLQRSWQAEDQFRESQRRISRFSSTIKALRQMGRATANDVLKINVAAYQASLDLEKARRDRQRAALLLGSLIGEYGRDDLAVRSADLPFPSAGDLESNPVLEAARRERNAAASDIQAARAERSPTFKLTLATGFVGVDPPQTFEHHGGAIYDGLVSIPVFEGGAISARIDEAKAREHQATAQQHLLERDLNRQFHDAALKYQEAQHSMTLLSDAQGVADDSFALAWARFLGGGNITLFEVLDAYQQAEKLRLDRFQQGFNANQAAAAAIQLLGANR